MSALGAPPEQSAEELFEEAPCGYLTTTVDGTILRVNRTFERWLGRPREELVGTRMVELLSVGSRIYHDTHYAPLLRLRRETKEVALEMLRADGTPLPVLVNSLMVGEGIGEAVRTTVFDISERRRHERELLAAQREEQEIAARLQDSMLTGELPTAPGLEIGVSYRPAVSGLQVGGDWYDAFWLSDGRLGLVVGDVVGRGIGAAATMGQLRSAVRALASTDMRPDALLGALDAFAHRHGVGVMATVIYAELDLAGGSLRFACAGHPPPVLSPAEGVPRLLWDGRSWPLDAFGHGRAAREEAECALVPGDLLLLYTDGLVERRGQRLDDSLETVRAKLAAHRGEAPAAITDALVRELSEPEHPDDVCTLAVALS